MGTSSNLQSYETRHKVAMGLPSMDSYHHQTHNIIQPQAPPIYSPGKYPSSTETNPYSPSFNDYHYQQSFKPAPLIPDPNEGSSSGRYIIILMTVLVSSMCLLIFAMYLLFHTDIPEFQVASLKVSNFSATDTNVTGKWDANVLVKNTNKELSVQFEKVKSSVYYEEVVLGVSCLEPFQVDKDQEKEFHLNVSAKENLSVDNLQRAVLPTLVQERNNGEVTFGLKLTMTANFTSSGLAHRQQGLKVLCEKLQVNFTSNSEGVLIYGLGIRGPCSIRLRESPVILYIL
ncbi:hypothetical protein ACJIZ3_021727 [Penstemon smallii]|uniref:Late embryogenesis abundant protein LEA-2 subgroup domain-containing protein n=1 Tax=Penstemon smallii TaxID=265156 RepID=A0ABD3SMF6_9LAMI